MGGEIHESACSIHTDDVWQEIVFDDVTHRTLANSTVNVTKPINIRLVNCSLEKKNGDLWSNVAMTFDGTRDANSPELFSVQGSAKGVGLLIASSAGKHARPGESLPSEDLYGGDNEIKYSLNLVKNGEQLQEGDWFSVIRFIVAYQ